jgi:hypothetical protein
MAQIQKLLVRLLSLPKDFTWEELTKILSHFGYKELKKGKTGGSRRKFADEENHIIDLHKPHPKKIMKRYQLEDVIVSLKERGRI